MTFNTFPRICETMGIGPGNPTAVLSEGPPRLTARYRANGGGFQEAIVIELGGSTIHVTIFQNSWDGTVNLPGNPGFGNVPVGPHALHLTDASRWFFVVEGNGSLRSLYPDIGSQPTERTRKAMDGVFMPVLNGYLFA